jgi:hypothetical protein
MPVMSVCLSPLGVGHAGGRQRRRSSERLQHEDERSKGLVRLSVSPPSVSVSLISHALHRYINSVKTRLAAIATDATRAVQAVPNTGVDALATVKVKCTSFSLSLSLAVSLTRTCIAANRQRQLAHAAADDRRVPATAGGHQRHCQGRLLLPPRA